MFNLSFAEHSVARHATNILLTNGDVGVYDPALGYRAYDSSGEFHPEDKLRTSAAEPSRLSETVQETSEFLTFATALGSQIVERTVTVPTERKTSLFRRPKTIHEEQVRRTRINVPAQMTDPRTDREMPAQTVIYRYDTVYSRQGRDTHLTEPGVALKHLQVSGTLPRQLAKDLHDLTLEKPVVIRAVAHTVGRTLLERAAAREDEVAADRADRLLPDYSKIRGPESGFTEWPLFVAWTEAHQREGGNGDYGQTSLYLPSQGKLVPVGATGPRNIRSAL